VGVTVDLNSNYHVMINDSLGSYVINLHPPSLDSGGGLTVSAEIRNRMPNSLECTFANVG
jgi:hypothetical protein